MKISQTFVVFLAAYARLQELEMKRFGVEEIAENKGRFRPLEGAEAAEYDGLKLWWNEIGADNQIRIRDFSRECGAQISAAGRGEVTKKAEKSALILPSSFRGQ